jgi:hypothetical protein
MLHQEKSVNPVRKKCYLLLRGNPVEKLTAQTKEIVDAIFVDTAAVNVMIL